MATELTVSIENLGASYEDFKNEMDSRWTALRFDEPLIRQASSSDAFAGPMTAREAWVDLSAGPDAFVRCEFMRISGASEDGDGSTDFRVVVTAVGRNRQSTLLMLIAAECIAKIGDGIVVDDWGFLDLGRVIERRTISAMLAPLEGMPLNASARTLFSE